MVDGGCCWGMSNICDPHQSTLYVVRVTKRCDIGYVTFRKEHHKESSQHQKT